MGRDSAGHRVRVPAWEPAALPGSLLRDGHELCGDGAAPPEAKRPRSTQATGNFGGSRWVFCQLVVNSSILVYFGNSKYPKLSFCPQFQYRGQPLSSSCVPRPDRLLFVSDAAGTAKTKTFLSTMVCCFPRRTSAVLIQYKSDWVCHQKSLVY